MKLLWNLRVVMIEKTLTNNLKEWMMRLWQKGDHLSKNPPFCLLKTSWHQLLPSSLITNLSFFIESLKLWIWPKTSHLLARSRSFCSFLMQFCLTVTIWDQVRAVLRYIHIETIFCVFCNVLPRPSSYGPWDLLIFYPTAHNHEESDRNKHNCWPNTYQDPQNRRNDQSCF